MSEQENPTVELDSSEQELDGDMQVLAAAQERVRELRREKSVLMRLAVAGADLAEGVEKVRLDLLRGYFDEGEAARKLYDLLQAYERVNEVNG